MVDLLLQGMAQMIGVGEKTMRRRPPGEMREVFADGTDNANELFLRRHIQCSGLRGHDFALIHAMVLSAKRSSASTLRVRCSSLVSSILL
jgi:hypothetical protein